MAATTSAIVSDTTTLIVLGKQQRLDLLRACFERVLLPPAVYAEWLAGDATVATQVGQRDWLEVTAPDSTALLEELHTLLDAGEAEAIVLASQRDLPLLIDERKGRNIAKAMGIAIFGMVGLLLLAIRRRHLTRETAKAILRQAKIDGFRLHEKLERAFEKQLLRG